MILSLFEQQQLAYCWLREANAYGENPVVYAGHEYKNGNFALRFYLLKRFDSISQYGTIHIPLEQIEKDIKRFEIGS